MRKSIGNDNKKAREAAVKMLGTFKGKNVKLLKNNEFTDLVIALFQLLGIADENGKIK